jgi:hypothetical protein
MNNNSIDTTLFDGDMSLDAAVIPYIEGYKSCLLFGNGKTTSEIKKLVGQLQTVDDKAEFTPNKLVPLKDGFYDLENVTLKKTSLVIVDGCSILDGGKRERLMEYKDKLNINARYLVDDTHRESERKLAIDLAAWKGVEAMFIKTELKEFAVIG